MNYFILMETSTVLIIIFVSILLFFFLLWIFGCCNSECSYYYSSSSYWQCNNGNKQKYSNKTVFKKDKENPKDSNTSKDNLPVATASTGFVPTARVVGENPNYVSAVETIPSAPALNEIV